MRLGACFIMIEPVDNVHSSTINQLKGYNYINRSRSDKSANRQKKKNAFIFIITVGIQFSFKLSCGHIVRYLTCYLNVFILFDVITIIILTVLLI